MNPSKLRPVQDIILVVGDIGGDAGYSVLTPHGVVRVPGNNPEAREAVSALVKNYAVLQEIALKEEPGLANSSVAQG